MIKNISTVIDIGSGTTKIVVAEFLKGINTPKIIGFGESQTTGVRHGYIINKEDTIKSLRKALDMAEKTSNIKIKKAILVVDGISLKGEIGSGFSIISKSDGEVTNIDIEKAINECEKNLNQINKKILQIYPISFKLDGKEVFGKIEGLKGNKLEIKTFFITYSNQHLEDLIEVISKNGVEVIDIIPSSIAASSLVLNKRQKMVGVGLADIGAEIASFCVFENNTIISLQSFPIGSNDITNDIAIGMKVSLEEAEKIKTGNYGNEKTSKRKIEEIIEARLSDIFELIENHLKKIKRNSLLPSGIVWMGGGANTIGLEELSKKFLNLPSKIATTDMFGNNKTKLKDPSWLPVLGVFLLESTENIFYSKEKKLTFTQSIKNIIKNILKQLMP